jgi:hypothetical protein
MKAKSKPAKPLLAHAKNKPIIPGIQSTGAGLAATEFRGLAPEEYEAACIFEMIADLSREERRKVTADLQSVVRIVQSAENQLGREGSNRPSWSRLDRNGKVLVAKRTRGTMVNQSPEFETAVSFITGDQAAFINDQVSHPSQVNGKTHNTSWPLTSATGTTDRQTIALTICWETGLHRIKSDINEWLEKNAPRGTPKLRPSKSSAHATGSHKADGISSSNPCEAIVDSDEIDWAAPAKGKSPNKKPAAILLRIAIRRLLRSGTKPADIPNRVATKRVVDGSKRALVDAYQQILKVSSPDLSKPTR